MAYNLLKKHCLDTKIKVGDMVLEPNADFRCILKCLELMKTYNSEEQTDEVLKENSIIIEKIFNLFYGNGIIIKNDEMVIDLWTSFLDFLTANDDLKFTSDKKETNILLDYELDHEYIFADFMRIYNINLARIEYLHYYEFIAMLSYIVSETSMSTLTTIRSSEYTKLKTKDKTVIAERKRIQNIYKIEKEQVKNRETKEDRISNRYLELFNEGLNPKQIQEIINKEFTSEGVE